MEIRNDPFRKARLSRRIFRLVWVAPATLFAVFAVTLSATSQKEVSKLTTSCGNGEMKACEKLKKIASEDKDEFVRQSAVQGMTDQPSLVEIALGLSDEQTSLLAVGRITDSALLTRIAMEAKSARIRLTAAGKLVDEQSLKRLLAASNDPAIREFAQESLDWKAADTTGTVAAYTDFLQKHTQTNHLRVESATFAIDHFQRVSNSNSVSVGPNGEINPTNFHTVIYCELMKDGQGTGETITVDEAEKRGFITRDPKTGMATAVYKLVQRKLYKRANGNAYPNWVFIGDLEALKLQDH